MADPKEEKGVKDDRNVKEEKGINSRLLEEIQAMNDHLSKVGGSACDRLVLVCLKDEEVQRHFVKHIIGNEIFMGAMCWQPVPYAEEVRIIFEFRCMPPRICLIPQRFLVRMSAVSGKVVEIIDPLLQWR